MLKIRRSRDRLIFNMGIPIHGKDGLYIEMGPRIFSKISLGMLNDVIQSTKVKWNQWKKLRNLEENYYSDIIMGALPSQITSLMIVYSIVYWDAHQRRHQSSVSLAFVWGIHQGPVNSPHKWPVTWKMFPFDDVIMLVQLFSQHCACYWYSIVRC